MATAFPLPSTATPVEPPACPDKTGKPAAALQAPLDLTAYETPVRVRHTATAVPLLPRPTLGLSCRYAEAAIVTGAAQLPVAERLIPMMAPVRIPGAPSTTTASPALSTAILAKP